MIIDDGSLLSISASDLDADGVLRIPDGVYEIAQNVGVRLWQSSYNMSAGIRPHFLRHSRARGPRKYECICGVDKAGILYPFSNNFCHSRARGPRKYECICGVDKAGIGLGLLLVI